ILAAGERTGRIDRLPIGEDALSVSGLKIVGEPDALEPVDTGAGDAHRPRAGALVAPIGKSHVRRYGDEERLAPDRQTAPCSGAFELGGTRLRHGNPSPRVPGNVPNSGEKYHGAIGSAIDLLSASSAAYHEKHRFGWSTMERPFAVSRR